LIPYATRPDTDCNKVMLTSTPDVTLRCIQPEGHVEVCDLWQTNAMVHKHRAHVATVDAPFPFFTGGAHRRDPVAEGANRVDAALRQWQDVVERAGVVLA
jgi:hypothetical protein